MPIELSTQNLVQAGSTVIALTLIWALIKIVFNHNKHLIDVIQENTKVLVELKDLIKKYHEK